MDFYRSDFSYLRNLHNLFNRNKSKFFSYIINIITCKIQISIKATFDTMNKIKVPLVKIHIGMYCPKTNKKEIIDGILKNI